MVYYDYIKFFIFLYMLISAGGVVKRSIEVYRSNFGNLMRYIGLLFGLGIVAVITLVIGLASIIGLQASTASAGGLLNLVSNISGSFISFLVIWGVLFFLLSLWLEIAFMRTVSRAVLGQPKISIGEEWKQSRPLIWRTLGNSIVVALLAILPFMIGIIGWVSIRTMSAFGGSVGVFRVLGLLFTLLSIYGFFHMLYFSIRLCFSTLGIVVDGLGIKEALQKSSALVKGRWWGILWRILVPVLAILAPYYVLLFLGQIKGFLGIFFALAAFVYYFFCLFPLAMIPSQVLYVSAKESSTK